MFGLFPGWVSRWVPGWDPKWIPEMGPSVGQDLGPGVGPGLGLIIVMIFGWAKGLHYCSLLKELEKDPIRGQFLVKLPVSQIYSINYH